MPTSQEFAIVLREQRLGVSLDAALENLAARINLQSVALAVSAMRIAYDSGGGLAEALERSAATLRNQLAIESKIRALTSQGKLQAVIVGLLPMVLLLILHKNGARGNVAVIRDPSRNAATLVGNGLSSNFSASTSFDAS